MTDTIKDPAVQASEEKLSRSEQRKKNRKEHKGQKKIDPNAPPKEGLFTRIYNFFVEAKLELTKVVWPTRKETIDTTWRLLILVVLAGIYLGLVDGILSRILGLLV
ncbi:preprotein translocase subunit SecE [Deltaproteobacteria bacterium Smac51]|nr:preprotein translocase subunit SecE [Deltaproteobacteria bacterium Smac51]